MATIELGGNFSFNLDPKGRATIPSSCREAFAEPFTISLNNDFSAIALYPSEKWHSIGERLNRIPDSDARGMSYVRLIRAFSFGGQTLDGQGRILLPQALRQQTGIEREIRFVGLGTWLEIWDETAFLKQYMHARENVADLLAYVNDRYYAGGREGDR